MPTPDEAAKMVSDLTGLHDLVAQVRSGQMPADDVLPMAAGMVWQSMASVFAGIVPVKHVSEFVSTERPMTMEVTLLDGSKMRISMEALDA